MAKCCRCKNPSPYHICETCANEREKKIIEEIRGIDDLMAEHRLSMKKVRRSGFAITPKRLWGLLLVLAGIILAFSGNGYLGMLSLGCIGAGLIFLLLSWTETLTVSLVNDGLTSEYRQIITDLAKRRKKLIENLRSGNV